MARMHFTGTERPWLNLYGIRVRPVAAFGSVSNKPFTDPALIHRLLPDELLFEVFSRMNPYTLGRAACVCRKWRYAIRSPSLWQVACLKTWQLYGAMRNHEIVRSVYGGSWRKMWVERPRIRTDGLFVSRNTYVRAGNADLNVSSPVHMICYYRYLRFYPSGKFVYKVSSEKLKEAAKCMYFGAPKAACVFEGGYLLNKDQIEAATLYPGARQTVLRISLRLRGTVVGAYNRLDLLRLVTTGVNQADLNRRVDDMLGVVQGWQEDETHSDVPAISHKRGLTPFVYVPFEEVETSVLNLPVEKMDYFMPG